MKVYYIIQSDADGVRTLFHWGLFTWPGAAQDVIDTKLTYNEGVIYTIGETFINE
jgi:hypothetical protein